MGQVSWELHSIKGLLLGAEINILDGKGNLDLDEDYMYLDVSVQAVPSMYLFWISVQRTKSIFFCLFWLLS